MKYLRILWVVLVLCGISLQAVAIRLQEQPHLQKLRALNAKAVEFLRSRTYDSAKIYAHKSLELQDQLGIDSLKGDAYICLALAYYYHGQYDSAILFNESALSNYEENNKREGVARSLINNGIFQKKLSNYKQAVEYYYKAATLYEQLRLDEPLSSCWNSMANCYSAMEEWNKALMFNRKALAIRIKLQDERLIAQSMNNIGDVFRAVGQYDSATHYLTASFDYKKNDKDSSSLILLLQNLGYTYFKQKEFNKAEALYERAINISEAYGHREETALGYNDLAELFISQGIYDRAAQALDKSATMAIEMKTPEILKDNYKLRYIMHEKRSQWNEALHYRDKYDVLKDSLFTLEMNKSIAELEIKYQTEQREKDINALKLRSQLQQENAAQQATIIYTLAGGALLLLSLAVLAYSRYRLKNKANKRINMLMREMHHRVKNNLQMLSGLFSWQASLTEDVQAKIAIRDSEVRVEAMNLLHQSLYLKEDITQVNMVEFMDKLVENLKVFYDYKAVELSCHVNNIHLDADKAIPIGLIVNELVSNAYKYAFQDKKGIIQVRLDVDQSGYLVLIVKDNGKPLDSETAQSSRPKAFGLSMVSILAAQLQAEMSSTYDGGTCHRLRLKVHAMAERL
jgi:two-component system, sensor histidine kinase PdtaS